MSVLTLPVQPGQDAGPALRPVPWRRMLWVTWRQQRGMLVSVTAVLAAISVFLLIAGLKVHHDYTGLVSCHSANSDACAALKSHFNNVDWTLGNTILILMNLAPALLGIFTGPAVLARELETGTFRYAWTQGIGRVRWTIAKLILLGVAITILAWAVSQVFAWFFDPFLNFEGMNVLAATVFATRGIAFAVWTLIAFAIGAFLGMLIRRIIPAMAATLGVYLGLNLLAWLVLREDYPWRSTPPTRACSTARTRRTPRGPSRHGPLAARTGGATSRSAGSGPCSSSRPAGSWCYARCWSPEPSGWSAATPPEARNSRRWY
jgi:hypothetical protein